MDLEVVSSAEFVELALVLERDLHLGEPGTEAAAQAGREYGQMVDRLRASPDRGLAVLRELVGHETPIVRLIAAGVLVELAPREALSVFRSLKADGSMPFHIVNVAKAAIFLHGKKR